MIHEMCDSLQNLKDLRSNNHCIEHHKTQQHVQILVEFSDMFYLAHSKKNKIPSAACTVYM